MDTIFIFGAKYAFVLSLLVGLYGILKQKDKWKRNVLFSALASILSVVLALLSKYFYFDPRPFVVEHFTPLIAHAADNGFPSDHMLLVATVASVFLFIDKRLSIGLWIIAAYVGVSRVYVGVHHPIDVIGSTFIALISALIVKIFMDKSSLLRHKME